jgi:hypothetical protein
MVLALPFQLDSLGLLFAAAVVTSWLMIRTLRKPATTTASSPTSVGIPRETERWRVEFHEFVREHEARLDTKTALLQQLIVDADERIAKLESLGLDAPMPSAIDVKPATDSRRGPHFAASQSARNAAVYAMADAGNSAAAIANELGTPIGAIELILSLRARG